MLHQCWTIVYNAGPAMKQQWAKASYFLGLYNTLKTDGTVRQYKGNSIQVGSLEEKMR